MNKETKIPDGYNFKGGLKVSSKPAWIQKRGLKDGSILALPKVATQEYVNDLSCIGQVAVKGLSKRIMSWFVPTNVKLKLEQVGSKKLNDGQILPLFKAVAVEPKAKK